jgi:hypothetical protein
MMSKSKPLAFDTKMSRFVVFGGCALVFLAVAGWRIHESSQLPEIPFEPGNRPPPPVPVCPWRDPTNDLKVFYPNASGYTAETRILSGLRLELAARLGRTPTGDENALRVYPVYQEKIPLGVVLTRRVKGEHGGIEIVAAVGTNQQICGVRLQRLREPASGAVALQKSEWLRSFEGKSAQDLWRLGKDIPDVPSEARVSAESIVEGVRDSLILLAAATQERGVAATPHH